jgi:tRNA-2-methylthio-N6-dimethylallyladenosine synthase
VKIGVIGCVAQLKGSEIMRRTGADFVVGTSAIYRIDEIIKDVFAGKKVVDTSLTVNIKDRFESPIPEAFYNGSKVSAYITIQEGCNQFCTFCIVPITRGREVTRPSEDIIREVIELVSRGVREVVLLGQNVNGYGWNVPGELSFAGLLRELNKIEGLYRIRFTTSNPRYMTDELIDAMAEYEKVCEQLHLPVQSGSNRILKKMGRRYTAEEYLEIIEKLRKRIPNISITTDIIVGFPGETEEDFLATLDLVKKVEFDDIFSFKFSKRPGTVAEKMPNQVPEEEKAIRLYELQKIQDEITLKKMRSYVGRVEEILVEGPAERNSDRDSTGRTRTGKVVNFEGKPAPGSLVYVRITEAYRNSLRGELVSHN